MSVVMDRQSVEEDASTAETSPPRPWTPECIPPAMRADTSRLSYLLVDEIVGDTVTLAIAPWPWSDVHGRVRFDEPADVVAVWNHLLVHRNEIETCLYEPWLERGARVGDAF